MAAIANYSRPTECVISTIYTFPYVKLKYVIITPVMAQIKNFKLKLTPTETGNVQGNVLCFYAFAEWNQDTPAKRGPSFQKPLPHELQLHPSLHGFICGVVHGVLHGLQPSEQLYIRRGERLTCFVHVF